MRNIRKTKLEKWKIIPLRYDFMFVEIFNDEKNIDITESFLASYFCIDIDKIKGKLKLKNRNLNVKNKKDKSKQVDLILELSNEVINIELNNEFPQGKIDRNVVYVSNTHSRNLKYGEKSYNKIVKTHQINLVSVSCNEDRIVEKYFFRNEKGKKLTEKIQIDVIDMEKAKEKCYTHSKQEVNISKWCEAFLTDNKNIFKEKVGEMNMSKETKEKLIQRVEELSEDEECICLYTELSDRELTYNTMIEDAQIEGLKRGMEEGLEKGFEKGFEQGIEKGIEKGKKQGLEETAINIAKNMLKENIKIELIEKTTGLSIEKIEKIVI